MKFYSTSVNLKIPSQFGISHFGRGIPPTFGEIYATRQDWVRCILSLKSRQILYFSLFLLSSLSTTTYLMLKGPPSRSIMERMSNPLSDPCQRNPKTSIQTHDLLNESELKEQVTYYLREGPVEILAWLFHESSCPGDWDCHPSSALGGDLKAFYEGKFIEGKTPAAEELTSIIRYRWELGLLADQIVNMFGLPLPDNTMCILWNLGTWSSYVWSNLTDLCWYKLFWEVCGRKYDLIPRQSNQGSEFKRPRLYVIVALFLWGKSELETERMVRRIADFLQGIKRFNAQSIGRVLPPRRNDCSQMSIPRVA